MFHKETNVYDEMKWNPRVGSWDHLGSTWNFVTKHGKQFEWFHWTGEMTEDSFSHGVEETWEMACLGAAGKLPEVLDIAA